MSDKNKPEPAAHSVGRNAGRGVGWLLKKLMGREKLARLSESASVLRQEYDAGKRDAEPEEPRTIAHEVKKSEPAEDSP